MDARKTKKRRNSGKAVHSLDPEKQADLIDRSIKSVIGGLIGMVMMGLFSMVVIAFLVKAFVSSDEVSFQLLHSAITLVGTTLGAVLGYFFGKHTQGGPGL